MHMLQDMDDCIQSLQGLLMRDLNEPKKPASSGSTDRKYEDDILIN